MTLIHLEKISDRYNVRASGHANYDINQRDIVCAAVSALIQSFIIMAEEDEHVDVLLDEENEGEGLLHIIVAGHGLESAWSMLSLGLHSIADQYPNNVRFY